VSLAVTVRHCGGPTEGMVESVIILVRRREGISRMPKKYSLLVVDGCRFSGNSRARLRPIRPRVDVLDEVSSDIDPYYA